MTFSTRQPPRIQQSPVALTSLGAVGGARGVSAGALRIFVEFITTYDKGAIDQLENDLRQIDHAQNNSQIAEEKRQRRIHTLTDKLDLASHVMRSKFNTQLRSDLKKIEELRATGTIQNRIHAKQLEQQLIPLARAAGLTDRELEAILTRQKVQKQIGVEQARQAKADAGQLERSKKRAAVEGQLSKIQLVRTQLLPKLTGLAIGAVGGIVGGAILGVGFQLAQVALEKVGEVIEDLIDPARHAKEAVKELGEEVAKLADEKQISDLQAASEIVARFGISDKGIEGRLASTAAQAAAQSRLIASLEQETKLLDLLKNRQGVQTDLRRQMREVLIKEAEANGTLHNEMVQVEAGYRGASNIVVQYIGNLTVEEAVTAELTARLKELSNAAVQAANDQNYLAASAVRAAVAEQALANAVAAVAAQRATTTQAQIQALGTGESARTKALEAALERAQGGGGGGGTSATLRNIAEERALILLRQRLRLLGTAINLEKYSGKFLLEAINAKIAALQEEGEEQDRLNRLLDLQYRMSQTLRRQEGESIGAFMERRAQENRDMLAEQQDLEREALIDKLEDQKQAVEDEVALAELAEQKKEALRQAGNAAYIKNLQKQLEASRKADAQALEDKKRALEEQQKAWEKQAAQAVETTRAENLARIRFAFSYVRSIQDIYKASGLIQGVLSAKAFLTAFGTALMASGLLTKAQYDQIMRNLNNTLAAAYRAQSEYSSNAIRDLANLPGFHGLQEGGVVMLRNSSSPFGQNVRVGEGGTELGVILSNKVTQALREGRGAEQIGPFYVNRSDDLLRDKYMLRRTVKEAVAEALRS